MPDINFILYLKTLKPEDWNKMVTLKWTVKDVVAHMVGWEKDDVQVIKRTWETKNLPWWLEYTGSYDSYNGKHVEFYKNYTTEQLIAEWEFWQQKVQEEINKIGEENLKKEPKLFSWLFQGIGDIRENGEPSHYKHHYDQIKKVIES